MGADDEVEVAIPRQMFQEILRLIAAARLGRKLI
jgi:hypothetical protein